MTVKNNFKEIISILTNENECYNLFNEYLDDYGFISLVKILEYFDISLEDLEPLIENGNIEISGEKIRSLVNHSKDYILVDKVNVFPKELFHTTTLDRYDIFIKDKTLKSTKNPYISLCDNKEDLEEYFIQNKGITNVILRINTSKFKKEGLDLMKSVKGNWLIKEVPFKYISVISNKQN